MGLWRFLKDCWREAEANERRRVLQEAERRRAARPQPRANAGRAADTRSTSSGYDGGDDYVPAWMVMNAASAGSCDSGSHSASGGHFEAGGGDYGGGGAGSSYDCGGGDSGGGSGGGGD